MEINIRINGIRYTTLDSLHEINDSCMVDFLREWYHAEEYVVGQTSGSTGMPKEIRLLKKDMLASARITNDFFHLGADSRLLLCLSPRYIAGKMMLVRAMLSGANLCTVEVSSSPLKGTDGEFDFAAMVPMQVETSLNTPETARRFARVKQVIIGGAAIPVHMEKQLQGIPTTCYGTYGMTETVSHIALRAVNGRDGSPFYFALGEVSFEKDARECLIVRAPHLQQQKFVTNDMVRLIDSTRFEWLGRYDNVINSGGVKLFPESMEAKIALFVKQRFFIMPEEDARLGQRVVLVIEGTAWNKEREKRLLEQLKEELHPYEIPRKIYFREHFMETYSGKVIRKLN